MRTVLEHYTCYVIVTSSILKWSLASPMISFRIHAPCEAKEIITNFRSIFVSRVGASGYLDAESRRQSFNFTLSSESSSNVNTFSHNHSRNLMNTEESSSSVMQSRSNLNINQSADNLNSMSRSKSKGERSILGK